MEYDTIPNERTPMNSRQNHLPAPPPDLDLEPPKETVLNTTVNLPVSSTLKTEHKKPDSSEFKAGIWDDIFGGIKTRKEKNPADLTAFGEQVNECISHLNSKLKGAVSEGDSIAALQTITDFKHADKQNSHLIPAPFKAQQFFYCEFYNLLAFAGKNEVQIMMLIQNGNVTELVQKMIFTGLPPLLQGAASIMITKNGKYLLVATTEDIRCYCISKNLLKLYRNADGSLPVCTVPWPEGIAQFPEDLHLLMTSYSLDLLGSPLEKTPFIVRNCYDFDVLNFFFAANDEAFLVSFRFIEEFDKVDVETAIVEVPTSPALTNLLSGFLADASEEKSVKVFKLSKPFCTSLFEFTAEQTNLTIFELVKKPGNENEYELQAKVNKSFNLALDPSFMSGFPHSFDCLVLPTRDGKSIHHILMEDHENIKCSKLFDIPVAITNINHLSFNRKMDFILLNTNLGELHMWGKTRDESESYKLIFRKELPEKQTKIRITEDLDYIIMTTRNYMHLMPFSPFSGNSFTTFEVPWVKRLVPRAAEEASQKAKEPFLFFPFNNGNALLYIHPKKMFVYNTVDKSVSTLEDGTPTYQTDFESLKGAEIITIKEQLQWLFYKTCEEDLPAGSETKSHFLVYSITISRSGQKYQIDKIIDITVNGQLSYIHHQNIVLLQNTNTSTAMLMRLVADPQLKGKVVVQKNEFDIRSRLGITSIKPEKTLDPLVGFLSSEIGIIIRKPEELLDTLQEIKQPVRGAKSVMSMKKNQVVSVSMKTQVKTQTQRATETQRKSALRTGPAPGLESDVDSETEGSPQSAIAAQAVDTFSGAKLTVGEDGNPDHDSMDENFVKLDSRSSESFNKRPPPGSYEAFSLGELLQPGTGRVRLLGTAKIHCSGATFIKTSPCSQLLCLYGKTGFELLKVRVKTDSRTDYAESLGQRKERELASLRAKLGVSDTAPETWLPQLPGRFHNHQQDTIMRAFRVDPDSRPALPPFRSDCSELAVLDNTWEVPVNKVKLVTLRFRWKPRYQISHEQAVEISEEMEAISAGQSVVNRWVAIAFDNNQTYLYKIINNSSLISSTRLTKEPRLLDSPFWFKFKLEPNEDSGGDLLLSYTELAANGSGDSSIYIYDVLDKLVLRCLYVRAGFLPIYLDFGYSNDKDPSSTNSKIKHHLKLRSKTEHEARFHLGYILNESVDGKSNIALANIIFRNLQDYLETSDPKTESTNLEMLKNTFNSLSPFDFYQDPRFMLMAFVLNQPSFFKDALKGIQIENLISTNYLLELVFSSLNPTRNNSETDIAEMYLDCVQNRKVYPVIPAEWIRQMVLNVDLDGLTGTIGSKKILSLVMLSPTTHTVTGLTSQKDISLVPFPESEVFSEGIPSDILLKKVDGLLLNNPLHTNNYQVFRTRIPLELTNGSDFSIGFFQMLQKLPDEELQYKYKQIISYKWRMVYFHSLIYTLFFIFLNVMAYLYFGYIGNTWMGIVVLILNVGFIALDVKMFGSNLLAFSKNLNSWIDITVHTISAAACIITLFNLITSSTIILYIKIIAILVVSVRGIIQMKVFSGIRILIMLIGQIIIDLAWVPLVLGVIFILAGSIYTLVPKPDGSKNDLGFYESMRETFILLFIPTTESPGTIDTNSQGKLIRSLITVVVGSMFVQGIFNFVIAIFLQTFRKVNENKEVYELRSLLIEITDYDLMLRFMTRFMSRKVEHHFLVLVPVPKDGVVFENETRFDRINNIKDSIMVEMGKKSMELMGEQAKKLLPGNLDEIQKLVELGKQNARPTDPRVSKLVGMLDKVAKDGTTPGMDDFKNVADLMTDTLDGKYRDTIKNTQKAVEGAANLLDSLKQGESPSLEVMLDLVISMAGALDPSGEKGLAKKLTSLKRTITNVVQMAEKLKNGGGIDVPLAIDSAVAVASELTSGPLKDKIMSVGSTVKVVAEEAIILQKGGTMNIARVIDKTADALGVLGSGELQLQLKSRPVTVIATVITEFLKNLEEIKQGGFKDPETLLRIGANISEAALPDSNFKELVLSSQKILKCVRDYQKSSTAGPSAVNMELATTVITSAGSIVEAIYPEARPAVATINDVCKAIESASQSLKKNQKIVISDVASAVSPLISRQFGAEGKNAVEGIVEMIKLVEHQVSTLGRDADGASKAKDSLKKLPELLEGASKLIKLFLKDDEKVQQGLDIAVMSARLVQSRLDQLTDTNSTSENILQTTLICVDVMEILSPKVKAQSKMLKSTLELVNRQFKNLSQDPDRMDWESLLADLGTLTVTANKNWTESVGKITTLATTVLREVRQVDKSRGGIEMQYLTAGCRILNTVSSRTTDITDAVLRLAKIGEEVVLAKSQQRSLDLAKVFDLSAQVAGKFDPKIEVGIYDAKPIVQLIVTNINSQAPLSLAALRDSINTISAVVVKLDPRTELAATQASNFISSLLTWIESSSDSGKDVFATMNLDGLLSPLCKILEVLKPEIAPVALKFKKTAVALQNSMIVFRGKPADATSSYVELIRSVGVVVQEIDPRFSAPVDKVIKLAGVVEVALNEYETPTINGIYGLVDRVGELICECDSGLKPKVNQTLSILKLITNEINSASSGDPGRLANDPRTGLTALFGCVKVVLGRYEPKFLPQLDKIQLLVSGLAIQFGEFQQNGKISLESAMVTASTLMRELAPELQKPCQIMQSFVSVLTGVASVVHGPEGQFKPSQANWTQITLGVSELAETLKYDRAELIRVVGSSIQPILVELEAGFENTGDSFRFSKLFMALANCVKIVSPHLEEYTTLATNCLLQLEEVLQEQKRTKQFAPLKLMNCAIKILAASTNSYNVELNAFAHLFKEAQEQVASYQTGTNLSARDLLGFFKRIGKSIEAVLDKYQPASSGTYARIQKAIDLLFKTSETASGIGKPSEVIQLITSLLADFNVPKQRKLEEVINIAKLFESLDAQQGKRVDIAELVESSAQILQGILPPETEKYLPALKKTLVAVNAAAYDLSGQENQKITLKALSGAAIEVVRVINPILEPRIQQISGILDLLFVHSGEIQESFSGGNTQMRTLGFMIQSAQQVLRVIAPQQQLQLDRVANIIFDVDSELREQDCKLELAEPEQAFKILKAILNKVQPMLSGSSDYQNLLESILKLHDLIKSVKPAN